MSARTRKAGSANTKITKHRIGDFTFQVELAGPTPEEFSELGQAVMANEAVRKALGKARHRLLGIELLDDSSDKRTDERSAAPNGFRATVYDYNQDRALLVEGPLRDPRAASVTESATQPLPTQEEFGAAVDAVARDATLGPMLRESQVLPYAPMPPFAGESLLDGRTSRVVTVGLLPNQGRARHEIVGVRMFDGRVIRFPAGRPGNSRAELQNCGIPNAGQQTVQSAAGRAWITVSLGGTTIWRFLAVRPAASSGTNGSGIELRYLDYKGKRVLYRGHVPFLNVKYDGNACGPYRDWQNEEGMISAIGTDPAPGFRLCAAPATTILDSGDDAGNFLGTAIYVKGQEVVLVCEMQAGWYRYVSEWRLHTDGTIRPRFGFGAVTSSCVCNQHHHHVYWRLDFDLRTPGNNVVREFNDPPLVGGSKWHDKKFEIRRDRDPGRHRKWRVENSETGEAYDIIPGHDDSVASAMPDAPFGRGDLWITRYRGSEIDDGVVAVGPPFEANIDQWVNGESIWKKDVVVWYAGHFTHDVTHEPPGVHGHIIGPDLKLVKW